MSAEPNVDEHNAEPIGEFVVLIATMMSLGALSIDAVLPALPSIAEAFSLPDGNTIQQVVTVLMVGMTIGQLLYGPLSDMYGRKSSMMVGILLFILGSLLTVAATGYSMMLVGRFVQGFGVAAMRIIPMAIVRDQYIGIQMARVMSLAMAVFILVPCLAPGLGQAVLVFGDWRTIFWVLCVLSSSLGVWFWLRQEETLPPERRVPVGVGPIIEGLRVAMTHRRTLGYTLAIGAASGGHTGYILSAEQIFHDIYETGDWFAVYFALAAVSIGVASVVNAQIVGRFGMQAVSRVAALGAIIASTAAGVLGIYFDPLPLWAFIGSLSVIFLCFGLMLGNMNTIALEPMGDNAGLANSAITFVSGMIGVALGAATGAALDETTQPLLFCISLTTAAALVLMVWADWTNESTVEANPERLDFT